MLVLIVIIPEEKLEMPSRLPSPTDLTPLIPGLLIAKKSKIASFLWFLNVKI